ncbi:MAG: HRDC domain-containing protein [Verrucomicrobia bacterium]|nr:HRDC domain-containing protein [Verrucomicrobiota bacterium]MDE3098343.1 HRDC domain-containing protein [Verrucomicrobiota bacterium]
MIDTEEQLAEFLPRLRAAAWVALDTEADSLHAYPEKVCLIQISIAGEDRLVDPLAAIQLDPLLDALNAHELIMHGADYDLRLLEKHHQFIPSAIFDTMLAARLLGERQFGLRALVEKFLGVTLDKGPQKADWAQRPLTPRMDAYARNDTHYLKPLADRIRVDLKKNGRLGWHQETCAQLIADCTGPQVVDADTVWRVKGSSILGRPALSVLRRLWEWREEEAVLGNRPPYFVLKHETLVNLAEAAAAHRPFDSFLPAKMSPRRRAGLAKAIRNGLSVPAESHPQLLRRKLHRPSEDEFQRYQQLEQRRNARAQELGIDPTLIASRAMLGDLARDWEKHAPELMTWQRELFE